MKNLIIIFTMLAGALFAEESFKVVFDLTTGSSKKFEKVVLKGIVSTINHYNGNFKDLKVSVVAHGNAYKFFLKDIKATKYREDKELRAIFSNFKKRIALVQEIYDVEFLMCESGLKNASLSPSDIVEYVKMVPNAAVGLIDKQNDGFAYIPIRE